MLTKYILFVGFWLVVTLLIGVWGTYVLTHAGIWVDDKQIKKMDVEWMDVIKGGKLEITIRQHSKSVMYGHE